MNTVHIPERAPRAGRHRAWSRAGAGALLVAAIAGGTAAQAFAAPAPGDGGKEAAAAGEANTVSPDSLSYTEIAKGAGKDSLAVDDKGNAYSIDAGKLKHTDIKTEKVTELRTSFAGATQLALDEDGQLYVFASNAMYKVTPHVSSGEATAEHLWNLSDVRDKGSNLSLVNLYKFSAHKGKLYVHAHGRYNSGQYTSYFDLVVDPKDPANATQMTPGGAGGRLTQSFAFKDGKVYISHYNNYFSVYDIAKGEPVAPAGADTSFPYGMGFDGVGNLIGMTDKGLKRMDLKTLKSTDVGGLGMPVGQMTTSPEGKIYFTNGSLFRYEDSAVNPQPGAPVKASDLSELVLADVDGDGKGDILGKTGESSGLYWFRNKGNNTFAPGVKVFDSWKYTQTTAADFDGDGNIDLAAVDGKGNLKMWKGNGDGTFGEETRLAQWAGKEQTTSGDVDKDGIADLIALDTKTGKLNMWKGTGDKDNPFAKPRALSKWAGLTQTTASDVDGDGIADLIATDKNNVLKFWKSDGNTEGNPFAKPVTLTKWAGFTHTTAGDLDGDGKDDLLAVDTKNNQLKYWNSNGNTEGNPFSKPTAVSLETAKP